MASVVACRFDVPKSCSRRLRWFSRSSRMKNTSTTTMPTVPSGASTGPSQSRIPAIDDDADDRVHAIGPGHDGMNFSDDVRLVVRQPMGQIDELRGDDVADHSEAGEQE